MKNQNRESFLLAIVSIEGMMGCVLAHIWVSSMDNHAKDLFGNSFLLLAFVNILVFIADCILMWKGKSKSEVDGCGTSSSDASGE